MGGKYNKAKVSGVWQKNNFLRKSDRKKECVGSRNFKTGIATSGVWIAPDRAGGLLDFWR